MQSPWCLPRRTERRKVLLTGNTFGTPGDLRLLDRRPREPTQPDRPITRSITRLAEERATQKLRLSAFSQEYKPNTPWRHARGALTTYVSWSLSHRRNIHGFLLPSLRRQNRRRHSCSPILECLECEPYGATPIGRGSS